MTEPTARLRPGDIGQALAWGAPSAFFLVLLGSLLGEDRIPTLVVPVLLGIAGLTAWRTGVALMLVAFLVPIATWIGRPWNGAVAWPETLVVACLAGYTARRAVTRESGQSGSLNFAIYSLIAVVLGSLAVRLLVLRATIGGEALWAHLSVALATHYFTERANVQLDAAMRLIEGALLLHAGATAGRVNPSFAPGLIRSLVLGAAAAGALNLWRIWIGALRLESPVAAFFRYLATLRFNTHYGDVNAAGSYCMMTLLPALAAFWVGRRWLWALAIVSIGTSLVLSGSRSAIVAGIAAALVALYLARGHSSLRLSPRRARTTLITALLVAAACAGVLSLLAVRNATPALAALWIRVEFARTGIQMFRSAPVFGVGVGDYSMRSTEFASPQLLKIYPRENAHNNFLQVLSELGIVGLAVFVWVLGAAGAASAGNLVRDPRNPLRWAATAGALAFVISWLGGHPLLLDAPAFSFWLLLGTVAGWGYVAAPKPPRAVSPAAAASLVVVAVAISLLPRSGVELGRAELEHQGIGLSGWLDSADGIRHRLAGVRSTVFVPASARVVTVPLRAAETSQEVVVELRLDDRLANALRVPGDRWVTLRLPLPPSQAATRYRRLDLEVRSPPSTESPLLMIGKVTPM